MKIGILCTNPSSFSAVRLKEEARLRGHSVRTLVCPKFSLEIQPSKPGLHYNGKTLPRFDAVISRVAGVNQMIATSILRQFEQMGVFCLASSTAFSIARDKLRTLQVLSRHNIGIPASAFVFDKSDIESAMERVGGAPVIVKLLGGSQGAGVMLLEKEKLAKAVLEALQVAGNDVLIQRFVAESQGRDIRAFVIGDRVVAAMRRTAVEGEFRSNVHLGGTTEAITLEPEYEHAALLATHIIGLRVSGVDLLETSSGPQVLEVNSSPGLEGIEKATGINIAQEIISYLEEQITFPDLDLRERLSLGKGYAIVELPVKKKSKWVGKKLSEIGLREQEVQVLSIVRGSLTIPMPKGEDELFLGDKLVCFGKNSVLKTLLPVSKPRKKGEP